jgi:imidazolonepropionase-like amidohydrolase
VFLSFPFAYGQDAPPSPTLAIVHGQLLTDTGDWQPDGYVVIAGLKIHSVGTGTPDLDPSVPKVDVRGARIIPGLIDAQSRVWMRDSSGIPGATDGSLLAVDALDPFQEDWNEVVREGVTAVYVQPSTRGTVGGLGAVVSTVPNDDRSLTLLSSPAALQVSFGDSRTNRERSQRYEAIKKTIQGLVAYKKKWDDYEEYQAKQKASEAPKGETKDAPKDATKDEPEKKVTPEGNEEPGRKPELSRKDAESKGGEPKTSESKTVESKGSEADKKPDPPPKPERDGVLERLIAVLDGRLPVRIEVRDSNDFRYANQLWQEFPKFQWIVEDASDLQSATPAFIDKHPPLVLGPWLDVTSNPKEAFRKRKAWSKLLDGYAGTVAITSSSLSTRGSRWLRENIAAAVASGVEPNVALRSVTIDAARVLGVSDQIGSLSPGKRADILVMQGLPWDTSASLSMVVVGGRTIVNQLEQGKDQVIAESLSPIALPDRLPTRYRLQSNRTMIGGKLVPATLFVDGETIVRVANKEDSGKEADGPLIDVGNGVVTPSLFSALADLGLGDSLLGGTESDGSFAIPADVQSSRPFAERQLFQHGVFRVAIAPRSTNTLAGQVGILETIPGSSPIDGSVAGKVALVPTARRQDRFPASLAGQVSFVRGAFGGDISGSRLYLPDPALQSMTAIRKQELGQWVAGKKPVVFHVSNEAELLAALSLIEDYKLRAALTGEARWSLFRDRIVTTNTSILVPPFSTDVYQLAIEELVACHRAGISLYLTGDTAEQLRTTASTLLRHGVDESALWAGLVEGGSRFYGLPETTDRFVPSGRADFIIWDDSPFNVSSRPTLLVRKGKRLDQGTMP